MDIYIFYRYGIKIYKQTIKTLKVLKRIYLQQLKMSSLKYYICKNNLIRKATRGKLFHTTNMIKRNLTCNLKIKVFEVAKSRVGINCVT